MGAIEHLTISLPTSMADKLRAWVDTGDYASTEEVVLDALLALGGPEDLTQDSALDDWLRTEVVAALEEFDRDPASGLTAEQVMAGLVADERRD